MFCTLGTIKRIFPLWCASDGRNYKLLTGFDWHTDKDTFTTNNQLVYENNLFVVVISSQRSKQRCDKVCFVSDLIPNLRTCRLLCLQVRWWRWTCGGCCSATPPPSSWPSASTSWASTLWGGCDATSLVSSLSKAKCVVAKEISLNFHESPWPRGIKNTVQSINYNISWKVSFLLKNPYNITRCAVHHFHALSLESKFSVSL